MLMKPRLLFLCAGSSGWMPCMAARPRQRWPQQQQRRRQQQRRL